MKILTRYILNEFLKPFSLSLFGISVIILIVQIFNDLHFILDHKPGLLLTFKYFILQIPAFIVQVTPIAVLFGVLFSLSRLSKNSELMAMRAGGASILIAVTPIFFSGIVIFILCVLFNEVVVPQTGKMLDHTKFVEIEKQPEPSTNKFRQNISMIGTENQIFHIGSFDGSNNTMSDVLILEFNSNNHLKSRIDAKTGKYEEGRWVFYDGYLRIFDDTDVEISAQPFDRIPVVLSEKPDDFLKEQKELRELNLIELMAYVRQLKKNGSDFHKELVDLQAKIAMPFGCVILAVLGIPWGWTMQKYHGIILSFLISVLVAILYIGGMELGHKLGESGALSPFLSMWTMNILFSIIGPVMLIRKNH
jgi:lipopolysaccharide export system permease protein